MAILDSFNVIRIVPGDGRRAPGSQPLSVGRKRDGSVRNAWTRQCLLERGLTFDGNFPEFDTVEHATSRDHFAPRRDSDGVRDRPLMREYRDNSFLFDVPYIDTVVAPDCQPP